MPGFALGLPISSLPPHERHRDWRGPDTPLPERWPVRDPPLLTPGSPSPSPSQPPPWPHRIRLAPSPDRSLIWLIVAAEPLCKAPGGVSVQTPPSPDTPHQSIFPAAPADPPHPPMDQIGQGGGGRLSSLIYKAGKPDPQRFGGDHFTNPDAWVLFLFGPPPHLTHSRAGTNLGIKKYKWPGEGAAGRE